MPQQHGRLSPLLGGITIPLHPANLLKGQDTLLDRSVTAKARAKRGVMFGPTPQSREAAPASGMVRVLQDKKAEANGAWPVGRRLSVRVNSPDADLCLCPGLSAGRMCQSGSAILTQRCSCEGSCRFKTR